MDDFVQLISNVGFPITAFCALYYMLNTTIKELTNVLKMNTSVTEKCNGLLIHLLNTKGDDIEV